MFILFVIFCALAPFIGPFLAAKYVAIGWLACLVIVIGNAAGPAKPRKEYLQ